jgi:hypothetical protein
MAGAAADNSLSFLLQPERLARIHEQRVLYGEAMPSLTDYLAKVSDYADRQVRENRRDEYARAIAEAAERRLAHHLLQLAANRKISEAVSAAALARLLEYREFTEENLTPHEVYLNQLVRGYLANPESYEPVAAPELPDGSPIGNSSAGGWR